MVFILKKTAIRCLHHSLGVRWEAAMIASRHFRDGWIPQWKGLINRCTVLRPHLSSIDLAAPLSRGDLISILVTPISITLISLRHQDMSTEIKRCTVKEQWSHLELQVAPFPNHFVSLLFTSLKHDNPETNHSLRRRCAISLYQSLGASILSQAVVSLFLQGVKIIINRCIVKD